MKRSNKYFNMLRSIVFALSFLINLRLKHVNLPNLVRTTYGEDGIKTFWKYGNTLSKLENLE